MDLQSELIESGKHKQKGVGKASIFSIGVHGLLVGTILFIGAHATHAVDAEDNKIKAFVTQGAAPPPPPPPPPPPAAKSAPQTPRVQPKVQPTPVVRPTFTAPVEIPKEIPKVDTPVTTNLPPSNEPVADVAPAGVVGGVEGGVQGGVVGGEVGGTVGGEIGGVKGGEIGGVLGGKLGGTGTGKEGDGTGGIEAPVAPPPPPPPPPAPPAGPVRVGGNVKAPTVTNRVDPEYTNTARAGRVAGTVVVEAIIDKQGNVDRVRVIKGLPMGLSESAERAVRQWKFRPGTMGGEPVDVIFNLTVTFKLDN